MTAPDVVVAIERRRVRSTNVREVGYDARSETLEVAFHSGSVYRYGGVDRAIAAPLLGPGPARRIARDAMGGRWSYGGYVALVLRGGAFPYMKLVPDMEVAG